MNILNAILYLTLAILALAVVVVTRPTLLDHSKKTSKKSSKKKSKK